MTKPLVQGEILALKSIGVALAASQQYLFFSEFAAQKQCVARKVSITGLFLLYKR
jgi:hypothetical protein